VETDGGLVEHVEDPRRLLPSWAARRMRWLSPPLKVRALRLSER
jgi:hypothetical protein